VAVVDDRQALYTGWVCGLAHRNGVPMVPVRDLDGNYTNELLLELDWEGLPVTITVVVPAPPDDWRLLPAEP
jgi:hypothetical protein